MLIQNSREVDRVEGRHRVDSTKSALQWHGALFGGEPVGELAFLLGRRRGDSVLARLLPPTWQLSSLARH